MAYMISKNTYYILESCKLIHVLAYIISFSYYILESYELIHVLAYMISKNTYYILESCELIHVLAYMISKNTYCILESCELIHVLAYMISKNTYYTELKWKRYTWIVCHLNTKLCKPRMQWKVYRNVQILGNA